LYSLAGFESRNGPRQPSENNNRPGGGFRRGGNQHGASQIIDGYYENGYNEGKKNVYWFLFFKR